MAYSFTDPYRSLRIVLRVDGLLVGIGLGLVLLLLPERMLRLWGVDILSIGWPYHLAGAALMGLGIFVLMAAGERSIGNVTLVPTIITNLLIVVVLFMAYIQGELADLTTMGQGSLLIVFIICLVSGVYPLRYFRAEYQM